MVLPKRHVFLDLMSSGSYLLTLFQLKALEALCDTHMTGKKF
jgi:hypothetical protein